MAESDVTEVREKRRAPVKTVLRWALLAVLVGLIVRYLYDNQDDLAALGDLTLIDLVLLLGLQVAAITLHALRTYAIVARMAASAMTYFQWLKIFVVGRLLNLFMAQAGNLYRAYTAKKNFDIPYDRYLAASALFTWLDTAINLLLALALFTQFRLAAAPDPGAADGFIEPWHVLAVLLLWLVAAPLGTRVGALSLVPQRITGLLTSLLDAFWQAARDHRLLLKLAGLGLLSFAIMFFTVMVGFQALQTPITLYQAAILMVLLKLSIIVVITPGNVGIREWALGGGALLLGLDVGIALLVSIVLRMAHVVAVVVLGSLFGASLHARQLGKR